MPFKKAKDYNFIISFVLLIAIAGYIAFQEARRMSLVSYLKTLQETVAESIYEEEERARFNSMFNDFLAKAAYENLDQEEIDSLSKKVLSLRFKKDSLDFEKARQFIPEPDKPKGENSIVLSKIIPRVPGGDWEKERNIFIEKCREYDSLKIHVEPPAKALETMILKHEMSYRQNLEQLQRSSRVVEMHESAIVSAKPHAEVLKDIEKELQAELQILENQNKQLRLEIEEINSLDEDIEARKKVLLNDQRG